MAFRLRAVVAGFVGVLVGMLFIRSAVDAGLVLLAWPGEEHVKRPRYLTAFWSRAVPILLGSALMLSHGGVGRAWWRRLPPRAPRAGCWPASWCYRQSRPCSRA
jgi:hypothetical protein